MMPNRHSLFWRLALVLVAFFLLSVWLSWTWGRSAELKGYYLSAEARSALADYARRAERAWLDDGREGIDRWLAEPRQRALDWWSCSTDGCNRWAVVRSPRRKPSA